MSRDELDASHRHGIDMMEAGRHVDAEAALYQVAEQAPGFAPAHFYRGVSLQALGRYEDAAVEYRMAAGIAPVMFEAHNNLGMVLQKLGRYDEALAAHDRAVQINRQSAEAHNSRGACLAMLMRDEEALESFDLAIAIVPEYVDAINNRAILLHRQRRWPEALAGYDRAIDIADAAGLDANEARYNRGLVKLTLGHFADGWVGYDYRLRLEGYLCALGDCRHGQSLQAISSDKPLFVRAEQGYGDTLQFVRFVPLLRSGARRVVVECQLGLKALLTASDLCDEIVERSADNVPLPCSYPDAVEVFVQSLPRLLGVDFETIPNRVPYLRAPAGRRAAWASRLAKTLPAGYRRIGIVWSGNHADPSNRHRACRLSEFDRLSKLSRVCWVSLQKGPAAQQQAPDAMNIDRLGDDLVDFADTAAVIENLDLVISVDTSVAHLAGALGKPVWLALTWSSDWRWFEGRVDSPWYPSMRLFRQPSLGAWGPVFEEMASSELLDGI